MYRNSKSGMTLRMSPPLPPNTLLLASLYAGINGRVWCYCNTKGGNGKSKWLCIKRCHSAFIKWLLPLCRNYGDMHAILFRILVCAPSSSDSTFSTPTTSHTNNSNTLSHTLPTEAPTIASLSSTSETSHSFQSNSTNSILEASTTSSPITTQIHWIH